MSVAVMITPPRNSMKPLTFVASPTPPRKGSTLVSLDTFLAHIGSVGKEDENEVDDIASSPLSAKIGGISRALKKAPRCKTVKKDGPTKRRCRASVVPMSCIRLNPKDFVSQKNVYGTWFVFVL